MIGVREAVVAEVVADGRNAQGEGVELAELAKVQNVALSKEQVTHLKDVHGVHVVVVLHVPAVAHVNLADKARQLSVVHLGQLVNVEHLQDVHSND